MSVRSIRNLGLLLLIGVLALMAYFRPGKPKEAPPVVLLEMDTTGIDRIEIRHPDPIVLERKPKGWTLTAPFEAPANPLRIEGILDITKARSEAQYSLKGLDLGIFGLDKPLAVLKLNERLITFGGTDPLSFRRYVQIGETLHLVSDGFSHHLTASATDFVAKKLIPDDLSIHALQLPGLKVERAADGAFTVTPPREGLDAKTLFEAWQGARAIEIQPGDRTLVGETIHLALSNDEARDFIIVQKTPELLLLRRDLGLIFTMTQEASRELLGEPPRQETDDDERGQLEDSGESGTEPHSDD